MAYFKPSLNSGSAGMSLLNSPFNTPTAPAGSGLGLMGLAGGVNSNGQTPLNDAAGLARIARTMEQAARGQGGVLDTSRKQQTQLSAAVQGKAAPAAPASFAGRTAPMQEQGDGSWNSSVAGYGSGAYQQADPSSLAGVLASYGFKG